jgi:hypothetical protein
MKSGTESKLAYENGFDRVSFKKSVINGFYELLGRLGNLDEFICPDLRSNCSFWDGCFGLILLTFSLNTVF